MLYYKRGMFMMGLKSVFKGAVDLNKYVRYDAALTDKEILSYALIIDRFKRGEINYKELEKLFGGLGLAVEPVLYDYTKRMISIREANIIEERHLSKNYLPADIRGYILNSYDRSIIDVMFMMDRKVIEVLADYGMSEYQLELINILRTQIRFTPHNKDNMVNLSLWNRRIKELEKELSNTLRR